MQCGNLLWELSDILYEFYLQFTLLSNGDRILEIGLSFDDGPCTLLGHSVYSNFLNILEWKRLTSMPHVSNAARQVVTSNKSPIAFSAAGP